MLGYYKYIIQQYFKITRFLRKNSRTGKDSPIYRWGYTFIIAHQWRYRPDSFAFILLSTRRINRGSHQCLNWWQQHATGMLHFRFSNLGRNAKKTEPKKVLSFLLLVYTLDVTFFSPIILKILKMLQLSFASFDISYL